MRNADRKPSVSVHPDRRCHVWTAPCDLGKAYIEVPFPLCLRNFQDLLFAGGIGIFHEDGARRL
jgi:hypothetical protein